jgi:outer membrane lipoprotein-sorting protein
MSEISALVSFVLFLAASPAREEPHELLVRADRVRNAWPEVVLKLRVTAQSPGGAPSSGEFRVSVKGDRARVEFLDPGDAGKVFLSSANDAWLILPTARNPIKVPKSHRLRGGFAAADVSRTRFADDYDAVLERTDACGDGQCDVIRLTAKKGGSPTYPVVRVWVDAKEGLYRRAVFLLASGRTAKDVTFDAYKPYHGVLSIARMTIADTLRPGTTVVDYEDYEKKPLPDALFDPQAARPKPTP